jgi:peptidyl-prolyl cis-trans isomerase C
MKRSSVTLAAMAAVAMLAGGLAQAQDKSAPAKGQSAAPAASKELYPKVYFDFLLKERLAQGQPDTPELRNAIRDELNTRELLVREAKKKGLDKNADIKSQIDLASQTVLVRAYVSDWVRANPIPDAALRAEYDAIKSQMGDKEYKVRHILLEKEDDAKEVIVELQKGGSFGDLDWNAPGNFVKPFSEAMVKLPKGKFTPQPVQTQFGWHVIEVTDIREAKIPSFDEVKPQLQQRLQAQNLDNYFKELRTKGGL